MPIEKLISIPTFIKVEGGYQYDEKFIGKTFIHNNSLIYFKDKSIVEIPLEVINVITKQIKEEIIADKTFFSENINNIAELDYFKKLQNEIAENKNKLKSINDTIKTILSTIDSFTKFIEEDSNKSITEESINTQIDKKLTKFHSSMKSNITEESVNKQIDKKLTTVYNSMIATINKTITDQIALNFKDSKRDHTGKLKMTTLLMLKEAGIPIDEIIALSKEEII